MSSQTSQTDPDEVVEDDEPLWEPRHTPRWTVPFVTVMAVLTVLVVGLSARAWTGGSGAWTALLLALAVLLGHAVGYGGYLGWCTTRRGPRLPESTPAGTTFGYSRWGYYWYVSVVVLAVAGLALFAVLSLGNGIGGQLLGLGVLALCLVVSLSTGVMLRLAPGNLTLTPDGLHHRGLSHTQYSPWSGVVDIEPVDSGHERDILIDVTASDNDRIRHYLPKPLRSGHPMLPSIVVSDTWLVTDPVLVFETLRHYHLHPADRAELGTPAALDRIRHRRWTRPERDHDAAETAGSGRLPPD